MVILVCAFSSLGICLYQKIQIQENGLIGIIDLMLKKGLVVFP